MNHSDCIAERILNNVATFLGDTWHARATEKLTDEDLEYWGAFYEENHLHARGILFATFMEAPREIAQALLVPLAPPPQESFAPLLPKQRLAIARTQPTHLVRAASR